MTRPEPPTDRCRLLVAEEDRAFRAALREAFDLMGCEVELAQDAIHAESLLAEDQARFHAVVADFATAVAGGLLRRLQQEEPPIPAVVLLPQGESYRSYQAREAGAATVLSKPVRLNALGRALARIGCDLAHHPAHDPAHDRR